MMMVRLSPGLVIYSQVEGCGQMGCMVLEQERAQALSYVLLYNSQQSVLRVVENMGRTSYVVAGTALV
jgi:hypothetical protein